MRKIVTIVILFILLPINCYSIDNSWFGVYGAEGDGYICSLFIDPKGLDNNSIVAIYVWCKPYTSDMANLSKEEKLLTYNNEPILIDDQYITISSPTAGSYFYDNVKQIDNNTLTGTSSSPSKNSNHHTNIGNGTFIIKREDGYITILPDTKNVKSDKMCIGKTKQVKCDNYKGTDPVFQKINKFLSGLKFKEYIK